MRVRKHFYFYGRVQGVGFRYRAVCLARSLELTGWVRNLPDGRVEMEAQGEEVLIWNLLTALNRQPMIRIDDVDVADRRIDPEEKGFDGIL